MFLYTPSLRGTRQAPIGRFIQTPFEMDTYELALFAERKAYIRPLGLFLVSVLRIEGYSVRLKGKIKTEDI